MGTYYTKERWVTARPRSKRLQRLGVSSGSVAVVNSLSASATSSTTEEVVNKMVAMKTSTLKFTTSQGVSETEKGQCYYDGDLGLPLWWDGSNWVDSTGARLLACRINDIESKVLEGSSLVVEIGGEETVTVLMGGEDVTQIVVEDGVVTIPIIIGDIEINYNAI